MPLLDPNQVVAVERDERVVNLLNGTILKGENDVDDRNRPASINEGPQDSLKHVGLSSRPSRGPPRLERGVGESSAVLISRMAIDVPPTRCYGTVCSNYRLQL